MPQHSPKPKVDLIEHYDAYKAELKLFLTNKITPPQDAEDILQELYIKIANLNADKLPAIDKPKQYLFKVANNMAIDHIRKNARHQNHFQDVENNIIENSHFSTDQPDRIWENQQKTERLRQAISAMPSKRRQAFLLFKYRNLTRQEIANELDLSIAAVEKHIVRALKDCRDFLYREDA